MTEIRNIDEAEEFGTQGAWRLLSRSVVDGQRTTVRGLCIQGKGVLVQTGRQVVMDDGGFGPPEFDAPTLVSDVLMVEFLEVTESAVTDAEGRPVSVTQQFVGRELVSTAMAKKKFQPNKSEGQHLTIMPGVALTIQTSGAMGA